MSTSAEFTDWLHGQLDNRGWTQVDFARRAGLSPAGISKIMSGDRQPGLDAIAGIVRALNVPADDVLRRMGLLPPKNAALTPEDRRLFQEMVDTFTNLSPENQRLAFTILEKLKRSEGR